MGERVRSVRIPDRSCIATREERIFDQHCIEGESMVLLSHDAKKSK
jgi:hypothetical protein